MLSQSWQPAQDITSASFLLYSLFLLHLSSLSQQAKKKEHHFPPTALLRCINRFFADCTAAAALGELNSETGSAAAAAATSDRTLTGQMRCSLFIFNTASHYDPNGEFSAWCQGLANLHSLHQRQPNRLPDL